MHVLMGCEVDDRPIRVKIEVVGEGDFGILVVEGITVHIPILQVADHVKSAFVDGRIHDRSAFSDIVLIYEN